MMIMIYMTLRNLNMNLSMEFMKMSLKLEQLMAELKSIDKAENESNTVKGS